MYMYIALKADSDTKIVGTFSVSMDTKYVKMPIACRQIYFQMNIYNIFN